MVSSVSSVSQLNTLHQLQKINNKQTKQFSELANGKKDPIADAVANAKTETLTSFVNGYNATNHNISSAQSMLGVANGGLNGAMESLQKLRDYALQASDGSLDQASRDSLRQQSDQVLAQINSDANSIEFNGKKLLDGSFGTQTIQTGPNVGDQLEVSLDGANAASLGVDSIDLSEADSASTSLSSIDAAISQLSSNMSQVGAYQNSLENNLQSNQESKANYAQAKQLQSELDYAQASGEIETIDIRKQFAIKLMGKANQANQAVYSLLK